MIRLVLSTLYFLLPAYFANMAPVFAQRLNFFPLLNKPIDGGAMLWGDFILGSGKTWRGIFVAVLMGIVIGGLEGVLYDLNWVTNLSPLPLHSLSGLVFGFLSGLGAILGDSLKSFFKRRVGIRSGNSWPVFDQIDFVIGAFLLTAIMLPWDWHRFIAALILTLILAPLSNWIGFHLTIKRVWW